MITSDQPIGILSDIANEIAVLRSRLSVLEDAHLVTAAAKGCSDGALRAAPEPT